MIKSPDDEYMEELEQKNSKLEKQIHTLVMEITTLKSALKVARDALRYYGGDKYGTFANEAYAKINEVLKP